MSQHPSNEDTGIKVSILSGTQLRSLLAMGLDDEGAARPDDSRGPYICDEEHVHGYPDTVYTVQVDAQSPKRQKRDDGTEIAFPVVTFNVRTNDKGYSEPLDLYFGRILDGARLRFSLLLEDKVVYVGTWCGAENPDNKS
jgi:hypothetical protein